MKFLESIRYIWKDIKGNLPIICKRSKLKSLEDDNDMLKLSISILKDRRTKYIKTNDYKFKTGKLPKGCSLYIECNHGVELIFLEPVNCNNFTSIGTKTRIVESMTIRNTFTFK